MALDLDDQVLVELGRTNTLSPDQRAKLDIAWNNDGGGTLMRGSQGRANLLPLPDARNIENASVLAIERRKLLEGSQHPGETAGKCPFFAVLTDMQSLVVVEVKKLSSRKATIRCRFLNNTDNTP